jgi:hypothetical protein
VAATGDACGSDDRARCDRLQQWRSREAWVAQASLDDQLIRSDGLGDDLLQSFVYAWDCWLSPYQDYLSLIMMYDIGIYATFCNNLWFAPYQAFNFCVYDVGTKMPFKTCVHAMETSKTCHNFWIYIKIGTTCMCLVLCINIVQICQKNKTARICLVGTRLNACSWWRDNILKGN